MIRAKIIIRLKPDVFDPEASALGKSLRGLGFHEVIDARIARVIELNLATEEETSLYARIQAMAEGLLANSVLEDYEIELETNL